MKHLTFVCGTAKSKHEDRYYIKAKNRFWRSLHEAGITDRQLEPREYRTLGKEYGIHLTELVDPEKYIIARDKNIEPFHLKDGLKKLCSKIENDMPRRIGFVGKNAAAWFYRYLNGMELTKSNHPAHRRTRRSLRDYGLLNWRYTSLLLPTDIECWLLTNTHRQWKREVWLDFWQHCKYDVDQFMRIKSE